MTKTLPDITGWRFGNLTAVRSSIYLKKGNARSLAWECVCDCGNVKNVSRPELLSKSVTTCGCRMSIKTHGCSTRDGFGSYKNMIGRCYDHGNKDFQRYGARGIIVCYRWLNGDGFKTGAECFFDDMGDRPDKRFSIERKNNNEGYSPSNCIWATAETQARNKRSNYFQAGADPKLVCQKAGVRYGTFRQRVSKGWSIEDALNPQDMRRRG